MNSELPTPNGTGAVYHPHQGHLLHVDEIAQTHAAESPRRGFSWQRLGGKFLVISVLAHILFLAVAGYFIVQRVMAPRKLNFQSGPKGPSASSRALEHKVQMKKQNTMSAPPQAKRITTMGVSKVALPDMPAMPAMTAALSPTSISGMGAAGVGAGGFGGGAGGGMGGNGGAAINFFGARTAAGGSGLKGTFYDLKQTTGKSPTNMNPGEYGKIMSDFVKGGFNAGLLGRFFRSDKPLYTTSIWIPRINADQGPAAFELQNVVQPKMWCVHYKGRVTPPASFTFHFVGAGDDILFVKFNGKTVLDRGYHVGNRDWKPDANYDYHFTGIPNGFAKGDAIKVEAGQSYPMEVVIGEQPGGYVYALLLQEIEGQTYEKVGGSGAPILPVFRMSDAKPAGTDKGSFPLHRDDGPVWKAESDTATKSFSVFDRPR